VSEETCATCGANMRRERFDVLACTNERCPDYVTPALTTAQLIERDWMRSPLTNAERAAVDAAEGEPGEPWE